MEELASGHAFARAQGILLKMLESWVLQRVVGWQGQGSPKSEAKAEGGLAEWGAGLGGADWGQGMHKPRSAKGLTGCGSGRQHDSSRSADNRFSIQRRASKSCFHGLGPGAAADLSW